MFRRFVKRAVKRLSANSYRPLNRIELDAIAMLHNVELIQKQHSGFEVIPVLKSNAYGHGLEQVAEILNGTSCQFLAVDGYFEAAKIRDITRHRILVLGYILPENIHLLDTKRCSFVVQDVAGLKAFGALGKSVKVHLELNTGFNRLGLQPDELSEYLEVLRHQPNLELEGIMTHLADADNERDDSFDTMQQEQFDALAAEILAAGFQPKLVHIAQTAGSAKIHSKYANAIRLGIGTYGISPLLPTDPHYEDLSKLKPVLELKSTIIKVLDLKKGDRVSYNGIFTAPGPMRIGVLPLGYYEGVQRALSNKGCVTYGDEVLPIVGRVCMNHTMIDLRESDLQVGDEVTVISGNTAYPNAIAALQARHGLFAYTTMTGIASSVHRDIINGGK